MINSFKLLKGILNLAYIFSICLWFISLVVLFGNLLGYDFSDELNVYTEELKVNSESAKIVFFIYILGIYGTVIYLIQILRKLVNSLNSGKLFSKLQSAGFNLIGQIIIWLVILSSILEFIFKITFNSKIELKMSFPDFWLYLALGAFFIVLGQVFEKARVIKEENELTV